MGWCYWGWYWVILLGLLLLLGLLMGTIPAENRLSQVYLMSVHGDIIHCGGSTEAAQF